MSTAGPDKEIEAIQMVIKALGALETSSQARVLDYVLGRLNLTKLTQPVAHEISIPPGPAEVKRATTSTNPTDIRTLKEQADPSSASEMAALVAYYLSELAPEDEKQETISRSDVEKYFKQAKFRLPRAPSFTLPNAKYAGYLDQVAQGQYRLNPVGYNLVVHSLLSEAEEARTKTARKKRPARRKRTQAKKGKKKQRKKRKKTTSKRSRA